MNPLSIDLVGLPAACRAAGWWLPADKSSDVSPTTLKEALRQVRQPLYLVLQDGTLVPRTAGTVSLGGSPGKTGAPLVGYAPPLPYRAAR